MLAVSPEPSAPQLDANGNSSSERNVAADGSVSAVDHTPAYQSVFANSLSGNSSSNNYNSGSNIVIRAEDHQEYIIDGSRYRYIPLNAVYLT